MGRLLISVIAGLFCPTVSAQQISVVPSPDSFAIACDTAGCNLHIEEGTSYPTIGFRPIRAARDSSGIVAIATADSGVIYPALQALATETPRATITWRGKMPATPDTIHVVLTLIAGSRRTSTQVTLISVPAAGPAISLRARGPRAFSWASGKFLPESVAVTISIVPAPQDVIATCEKQRIVFRSLADASVKPDTIPARWVLDGDGANSCAAATRWQLADAAGSQVLEASAVGAHTSQTAGAFEVPYTDFSATAVPPAHIIAGLSLITGSVRLQDTSLAHDTSSATRRKKQRVQPVIGVDVPLLLFSRRNSLQDVLTHVRLVAATFFSDPGFDLYVGAEILPIFQVSNQDFNVQASAGYRFGLGHTSGSFALLLTFDASDVLSNVLAGFGLASK